jgi:hypothetical protein
MTKRYQKGNQKPSIEGQTILTSLVSFGHCIVCSSIDGFWLPLWYLMVIVLSVLRLTASDYLFGIFWPLYCNQKPSIEEQTIQWPKDTKEVTRSRQSKNRQYNDQKIHKRYRLKKHINQCFQVKTVDRDVLLFSTKADSPKVCRKKSSHAICTNMLELKQNAQHLNNVIVIIRVIGIWCHVVVAFSGVTFMFSENNLFTYLRKNIEAVIQQLLIALRFSKS